MNYDIFLSHAITARWKRIVHIGRCLRRCFIVSQCKMQIFKNTIWWRSKSLKYLSKFYLRPPPKKKKDIDREISFMYQKIFCYQICSLILSSWLHMQIFTISFLESLLQFWLQKYMYCILFPEMMNMIANVF